MECLHHYTYVQVVHCNIKPNNVLLDEDMTGHVTDFGLARLIGAASTDSLTSTLALRGSMGYIAPSMDFLKVTFNCHFSLTILYALNTSGVNFY